MGQWPNLRDALVADEGRSLLAYQDSVGKWTIGIGHLLGDEKRMSSITDDECDALFEHDVKNATWLAYKLAPEAFAIVAHEFRDHRQDVIVQMAFQLGSRLAGFKKFLAAVEAGDWKTAGIEMLDSQWAKQVPVRAQRLHDQLVSEV